MADCIPVMNIVGLVRNASTIFSSHLQLQQNLLPVMGVLQRSIKTSIYQSQCSYTIFKKCCLNHWTFPPSDTTRHDLGDTVLREESLGKNQLECWNKHLIGCTVCGWEKWRILGGDVQSGLKATDGTRVSAVVIGSTGRGRGVWAVVIFAQRCGVVRGGVHVCLLKWRREVVGPLVRQQIVLIQSL